jgi:hypothetical protein
MKANKAGVWIVNTNGSVLWRYNMGAPRFLVAKDEGKLIFHSGLMGLRLN